jgi:hypothetical protein
MGRFMVFTGQQCYPCGGMNDFLNSFDTQEDATRVGKLRCEANAGGSSMYDHEWGHVYDTMTHTIVDKWDYSCV